MTRIITCFKEFPALSKANPYLIIFTKLLVAENRAVPSGLCAKQSIDQTFHLFSASISRSFPNVSNFLLNRTREYDESKQILPKLTHLNDVFGPLLPNNAIIRF